MADRVLVVLADEGYLEPARQILASVHFDAGWSGDLLLLAHQVPEAKLADFRARGILVQRCGPWPGAPALAGRRQTSLAKFQLFSPELRRWRNVVYVDSDMMFYASLERLGRVRGLAAVSDRNDLAWQFRGGDADPALAAELAARFDLRREAFNSGLLAFRTDAIRPDAFEALQALFRRYAPIRSNVDQGILNLCFQGQWRRLPDFYSAMRNAPARHFFVPKDRFRVIGRHFVGAPRPWDPSHPLHAAWRESLARFEQLDARRPRPARETWSELEIWRYWQALRLRRAAFLALAPARPALERVQGSRAARRARGLMRRLGLLPAPSGGRRGPTER
jgi:hypothetical protein